MNTNRFKPVAWKVLLSKYFAPPVTICDDATDYTFPPSPELISDLDNSYTSAKVEKFENGPTFSSYHVDYNIGGGKGEAIYKTTNTIYPSFAAYDSKEEYALSFCLND